MMDAKIRMLYALLIIVIIGISQMLQSCADFGVGHVDMLHYFLQCDERGPLDTAED